MNATPNTLRLHPAPDATVVIDELPGTTPAFIYLHGLSSVRVGEKSTALFEFADRHGRAAYRFDFRGHGDSSGELANTTLSELCDDAAAVLRYTGPAVLVGSSLGGLVASWTAARHPDLVIGLTVLAPAFEFLPQIRAYTGPDGYAVLPNGEDQIRLAPHVLHDLEQFDDAALPRQLSMPVQIVHGALDDVVPVEVSRTVFSGIPHDRKDLWVIENGDHRLNTRMPAILERMERFHALHRSPAT